MKLADLIDRLIEIHNEKDHNPEVSIMTEEYTEIDGFEQQVQFQRKVTDVAFSERSGIIIIGQEID